LLKPADDKLLQESCRWEILERMLRLVRESETLEDYKRLVSEGMHILNVLPGGVLEGWSGNPEVPAAVVSASEVIKFHGKALSSPHQRP